MYQKSSVFREIVTIELTITHPSFQQHSILLSLAEKAVVSGPRSAQNCMVKPVVNLSSVLLHPVALIFSVKEHLRQQLGSVGGRDESLHPEYINGLHL